MKKLLSLFLLLTAFVMISVPSFATLMTADTYYASGSTEGTVGSTTAGGELGYIANTKIGIKSILARSDLSSSVIKIYIGATTGATDNYTQVQELDLGDGTTFLEAEGQDNYLWISPVNYQVKVGVTSTTANSLAVTWDRL